MRPFITTLVSIPLILGSALPLMSAYSAACETSVTIETPDGGTIKYDSKDARKADKARLDKAYQTCEETKEDWSEVANDPGATPGIKEKARKNTKKCADVKNFLSRLGAEPNAVSSSNPGTLSSSGGGLTN